MTEDGAATLPRLESLHLVTLRDERVLELRHFLDPGEAEAAARE